MKKIMISAAALTLAMTSTSWANSDPRTPFEIASSRNACGFQGTIVSATRQVDGKILVRCARPVSERGGGATTGIAVGLLGVLLAAAAAGGSTSSTNGTN